MPSKPPVPQTAGQRHVSVDYYPEHWPVERWPEDMRLMQAAGVTRIRIAEFAWCRIEPEDGLFSFDWLRRVIRLAAEHGIQTILCTPTATPPAWLCSAHPEVMSALPDGRPMSFGGRRQYDPTSGVYRTYCRRIAREMGQAFAREEAVVAWQIDNELYGNTPCFTGSFQRAFQRWLEEQYGSVQALNERWGTIFWSQEYTSFDQIPLPDGAAGLAGGESAHHPSLQLAFRAFRSQVWIDFCLEQAAILRGINAAWDITTNAYLFRWGDGIDYAALFRDLDLFAFDNYSGSLEEGAFYNDLAASISRRYWTLEQLCAPPAGQYLWPEPDPGMQPLAEQAFDHGAELVSYFRWRQARFGHEQNHGAILPHDGLPREHYELLAQSAAYTRQSEPTLSPPSVLVYYSWADSWVRQISRWNDYIEYQQSVLHPGLAAAAGTGSVRFLFPHRLPAPGSDHDDRAPETPPRLLVIPMAIIHIERLADFAVSLAQAGATVVCTPDLGRKDADNVFREENLPTVWRDALGITVDRHYRVTAGAPEILTRSGYRTQHRVDAVSVESARVVDIFVGGPAPGSPAFTERSHGAGKMCYAGGLFERSFWTDLARIAAALQSPEAP